MLHVLANLRRGVVSATSRVPIPDLRWITRPNELRTFYATWNVECQLEARGKYGIDRYVIVDGELPEGFDLLSSGMIFGQASEESVTEVIPFTLTIRVYDMRQNFIDGVFDFELRPYTSEVTWLTMEGKIADVGYGQTSRSQVQARSDLQ